jgi:hypothetical protein
VTKHIKINMAINIGTTRFPEFGVDAQFVTPEAS